MSVLPSESTPAEAPQWGLPLLREMDWKRFQELTSLLLARAGFESEIAWIRPDGAVGLRMWRRFGGARMEGLLQCASWAHFQMDAASVREFHRTVDAERAARGILVTPGEFTEEAWLYAQGKNLELLDGCEVLAAINRMPEDERSYYLRLATMGSWNIPTCPSCGKKMHIRDDGAHRAGEDPTQRDVTLKGREFVGGELQCRNLLIKKGADILFLHGVTADSIHVDGRVMGNMVCRGKLEIGKKGFVSGLVAARSIHLENGGTLEAEARILNASEVQPLTPPKPKKLWGCPGYPKCKAVLHTR